MQFEKQRRGNKFFSYNAQKSTANTIHEILLIFSIIALHSTSSGKTLIKSIVSFTGVIVTIKINKFHE